MRLSLTASGDDNLKTVKQLLKGRLQLSEKLIKRLKFSDKILLNSIPVHVNATVREGDLLEALVESDEYNEEIIPEPMKLDILYEDDTLIAINKPADTVVHPTFGHFTGTLANGLMYYLLNKGIKTLIRPVSRLDRDTSGITVFALNPFIQENLVRQMHDRSYIKEYVGIVHGVPHMDSGTVDLPIQRQEGSIMLRHISPGGAPSVTHYEVLERFSDTALLRFVLETGRTHQIRVHCQATGHPLLGDSLYPLPVFTNNHAGLMNRQALHSRRTVFTHPFTKKALSLEASIPEDMMNAVEILRNKQF